MRGTTERASVTKEGGEGYVLENILKRLRNRSEPQKGYLLRIEGSEE